MPSTKLWFQNHLLLANVIKITLLILRQTTFSNSRKISYCSNPDTSILHHYGTSDHDTHIFEDLIFYIKLLEQTRQFYSTQKTNQTIITWINGFEIDWPIRKWSLLGLDGMKFNRNSLRRFLYVMVGWIRRYLINFHNKFIRLF